MFNIKEFEFIKEAVFGLFGFNAFMLYMEDTDRKCSDSISYYGGIWTWCGLLLNIGFTFKTMLPALSLFPGKCFKGKIV